MAPFFKIELELFLRKEKNDLWEIVRVKKDMNWTLLSTKYLTISNLTKRKEGVL